LNKKAGRWNCRLCSGLERGTGDYEGPHFPVVIADWKAPPSAAGLFIGMLSFVVGAGHFHCSSFANLKPGEEPGFNFGPLADAIKHNGGRAHLGGGCRDLDCHLALAAWTSALAVTLSGSPFRKEARNDPDLSFTLTCGPDVYGVPAAQVGP
jgi:hypothetical protein